MNLILNPGSTSTKIAVYSGNTQVFAKTVKHSQDDLAGFAAIADQKQYRSRAVMAACGEQGINLDEIEGVIALGGLLYSGVGGVYEVNDIMVRDLTEETYGAHASNLGGVMAAEIAGSLKKKAYIADPVTTDELQDVARLSGMPDIARISRTHTLNQKAAAAMAAKDLGLPGDGCSLVVAHLGGGISVAAHRGGLIVDTSDPRGEGPFCMDRAGGVSTVEVASLCYSGKYTKEEMMKKINGGGGVVAYLKTRDFLDVLRMCDEKNPEAIAVYNAMAYQVAKEIGAMTAALHGKADAIVFTGGMAGSERFVNDIRKYVDAFAKVLVYPGEFELEALASYIFQVQSGVIKPQVYRGRHGIAV